MEILKLLDDSASVFRYEVLEFRQWNIGLYYKIKVFLKDETILFIREYIDEHGRDYSFHWQDANDKLLIRWDNTPHHKGISTYPHHKHIGDRLEESRELQVEEVLNFIQAYISGKGND